MQFPAANEDQETSALGNNIVTFALIEVITLLESIGQGDYGSVLIGQVYTGKVSRHKGMA